MKKLRPQVWFYPDPIEHQIHEWSMRARSQAWYRGEEWLLTDREYIDLWLTDDRYKQRGRSVDDLCLTRLDPDGAWSLDNVHIITRKEHYKTCNNFKGGWKSPSCPRRTQNV
jgi:hypothetical protein